MLICLTFLFYVPGDRVEFPTYRDFLIYWRGKRAKWHEMLGLVTPSCPGMKVGPDLCFFLNFILNSSSPSITSDLGVWQIPTPATALTAKQAGKKQWEGIFLAGWAPWSAWLINFDGTAGWALTDGPRAAGGDSGMLPRHSHTRAPGSKPTGVSAGKLSSERGIGVSPAHYAVYKQPWGRGTVTL